MTYDPEKITFFAKTDARGRHVPFGIKAKDRTKHLYVIGKTGMGKSTLLENMAIQDIQNGEGVAFIDPHGSTAQKLLEYVPEERMKDVLYFAPFDMEYPVSFNVMEDVGPDKRHLVVSGLMSTFKKIWVDAWSARMEYILSNTLLALLEYPDSTLLGVNRMLSDKAYREAVVANVTDPSVKSFWVDEFAKYNERYMQEAGDAIKNKTGQFITNPVIRNIVGQPKSSFDIRQMMDDKKIVIMNLSKGLVGETNANLLGSMFITRIYLSAMSRADLSPAEIERAPNFYFYVDEFQSFANETFANILSEARKYKLNLTIAHQYIEQMEEEVRDAVFGNVGTTIAFRVGPLDAEFLETVFTPQFLATDLVNLGFAQIYLTLMIDGIGSRPFSAVTLPPIEQSHTSYYDQIVAASRARYARPRAEVEEAIHTWHEPIRKPRVEITPKKPVVEASVAPRTRTSREDAPRERTRPPVPARRDASVGETPRPKATAAVDIEVQTPPRTERTDVRTPEAPERPTPRAEPEARAERQSGAPSQAAPRSKKHDLSALRSVLRTIAAPETGDAPAAAPGKRGGKNPARDAKGGAELGGAGDLKSALAAALGERASAPAESTPARAPESTPQAPSRERSVAPQNTHSVGAPAPVEGNGVSQKQLERMLRITGNDNPPLRR